MTVTAPRTRRAAIGEIARYSLAFSGIFEQSIVRAAQARSLAAGAATNLFEIQRVAEDVYAAIARPAAIINCNAAVFVNRKDILIVDAHSKPSAAASLAAQIGKEVSSKPIRYIVNTHFHYDHTQGMPAYRKLAPSAEVFASSATRTTLENQALRRLEASLKSSRERLEQSREALGRATAQSERAYYHRLVSELEAFVREMKDWTPELPDVTFDDHLVIHDAAHEIHLVFKGRAHTAGDICVYCPQKKVIATADVLSSFIPGMYDGYPLEWPATLQRIGQLDFDRVIPGHGAVQESKKRLHQVVAYIEEIIEAVRKGKAEGHTVEELRKTITLESLRTTGQTDYERFVEESVSKHMLLAPGARPRNTMENSVRTNIANIYSALPS